MSDQMTTYEPIMGVEDTAERLDQLAASAMAHDPPATVALHLKDAATHLRRLKQAAERNATGEQITVAVYWPGEYAYGGGTYARTMGEAEAKARELVSLGYGRGKSRIHIVRTVREVIEWDQPDGE